VAATGLFGSLSTNSLRIAQAVDVARELHPLLPQSRRSGARFSGGGGHFGSRRTPSEVAGYLVVVGVILLAVLQALPLLGFEAVAALMFEFLVFAGQVILGLAIIALGMYLGRVAADAVRESTVHQSEFLALLTQTSIIVLAAAMGLQQMGVGNEIIVIAFALAGGAIAVAAAVAFGIGGRDAAKDAVDRFYHGRILADQTSGGDGRHGQPAQEERRREPQETS